MHVFVMEGAGCCAFLWFAACVGFAMVCLFFILVNLVGYDCDSGHRLYYFYTVEMQSIRRV